MVGIMTGRALASKVTFSGFRVEVQGDVQLPGQQIAGASLGAQAVFDEGTDQPHTAGLIVGVMFQGLEHFLV